MKITGLEIISEFVEETDRIKKAEKEIRKQRIAELIAQGIEKKLAEVMVDVFTEYGVKGY